MTRVARRGLIGGLALAGLAIAVYLTLYQLGIVPTVWEPFFGEGSRKVLHSPISRLLPIPDASLGAVGYLVERWRGRRSWRASIDDSLRSPSAQASRPIRAV